MAIIKSFTKEKENLEKGQRQTDYYQKIRRHKLSSVYRALLVIAALAALAALVYVQYKNHIYTDYDEVSSIPVENVAGARSVRLGDCVLTYSNDGAHCTDSRGTVVWNQTYEMQDIQVAVSGNVAAIGDYNGRDIYVLSSTGKLGEIHTNMPIRGLAVAETGRVAVEVADTKVTWIHLYEADGTEKYEVRTTMSQSGYPVSFSLSPNGELLGISCIFVDSGVVKSHVAFYNFGNVGDNRSDYIVNAYTYPDTIVPYLKFINNSTAFAVGDDRVTIFSGSQIPTRQTESLLTEEIQAVYNSDSYIGLLFRSDDAKLQHRLEVYGSDGEKVGNYYFDTEFTNLFFGQDHFVAYSNSDCLIKTFSDVDKFNGSFHKTVNLMVPVGKGGSFRYIVVTNDSIDTIQLK